MLRQSYGEELTRLQDEIMMMGSLVEQAIVGSVEALKKRDIQESERIVADDILINEKRFAIEHDTLTLIATQQPIAGDLRTLASVLEIANELERMGDYAKGIGKINIMIGEQPLLKPLIDLPRMAEKSRDMLHRALEAFINHDVDAAHALPAEDDEVDDLYLQVYRELMTYILADPRNIEQANYLLWAAHNLERTADRVTNICERVIFNVTGKMFESSTEGSGYQLG
jgi:phosphate transport system protein